MRIGPLVSRPNAMQLFKPGILEKHASADIYTKYYVVLHILRHFQSDIKIVFSLIQNR